MRKRLLTLLIWRLVLILTPVLVACGAPPRATTTTSSTATGVPAATAAPAPMLIDLHAPDDLKARFNQDAGVPRIILLVSPT
jgi:hypothetical protein